MGHSAAVERLEFGRWVFIVSFIVFIVAAFCFPVGSNGFWKLGFLVVFLSAASAFVLFALANFANYFLLPLVSQKCEGKTLRGEVTEVRDLGAGIFRIALTQNLEGVEPGLRAGVQRMVVGDFCTHRLHLRGSRNLPRVGDTISVSAGVRSHIFLGNFDWIDKWGHVKNDAIPSNGMN